MAKGDINSLAALGKAVGISRQGVTKWTKHPDWMFGPGPWKASQLPKIKAWAVEVLQEDRAAASEDEPETVLKDNSGSATSLHTRAKTLKLTRDIQLLELKLKEKKESVHDISECRKQQIERVHQTKNVLTSQVPLSAVQDVRAWERQHGRAIADVDLATFIRNRIEEAIASSLAPPEA